MTNRKISVLGRRISVWGSLAVLFLAILMMQFMEKEKIHENKPNVSLADSNTLTAISPEKNYQTYCSSCHGNDGQANTPMAKAMAIKPTNLVNGPFRYEKNYESYVRIISYGIGSMPGYREDMSPEAINELAHYTLGLASE